MNNIPENEFTLINYTARGMAVREDLRFAFINDKNAIAKLNKNHPDWFSQNKTSNFIIIKRGNETLEFVDIPIRNFTYFEWINEYFS